MRTGRIPEKITVVVKPAKKSKGDGTPHSHWSFPPNNHVTKGFGEYTASPAFVVPADSEKSIETAKKWGAGRQWGSKSNDPYEVKADIPNAPINGLRWVGIDSRTEGGVAYKVVTPEGWLVDLREDVLIECLYDGCIKGGIRGDNGVGTYFDTQFVWVQIGSQTRLVKVGSKLHKEMGEATERRTLKKIPNKELEVGGIYSMKNKTRSIFLGRIKGEGMVLFPMNRYGRANHLPQEQLDGQIGHIGKKDTWPDFQITKSTSFVEKVGTVTVPDDLMERYAKRLALRRAEQEREQKEWQEKRLGWV